MVCAQSSRIGQVTRPTPRRKSRVHERVRPRSRGVLTSVTWGQARTMNTKASSLLGAGAGLVAPWVRCRHNVTRLGPHSINCGSIALHGGGVCAGLQVLSESRPR